MTTFTIPGKATGKGRPRFGQGRTYTPTATRDYEQLVRDCAALAHVERVEGPVEVYIVVMVVPPKSWSKKRRSEALMGVWAMGKPDLDNVEKIILDSLNGIAYGDDTQVVKLRASRIYGEHDSVTVSVEASPVRPD